MNSHMTKCNGKNCPNGGYTNIMSDDTLVVGKKAYCSVCLPESPAAERAMHKALDADGALSLCRCSRCKVSQ